MILGEIIESQVKLLGMTKAEFGRRIQTSRQNVNDIFRKEHLNTKQLSEISKVLRYDFYEHIDRPYRKRNKRRVILLIEVPDDDNLNDLNIEI